MRSGRGAMHEEMWETRSDKTTKIELFQLWVNLPAVCMYVLVCMYICYVLISPPIIFAMQTQRKNTCVCVRVCVCVCVCMCVYSKLIRLM
jgi:hypothetical protein